MFKENIPLSVCIITKNEEGKLSACLESVNWVSEVIVVDDFSSDKTPEICQSFKNTRYVTRKFIGFGDQKRSAVSICNNDWVLNIDADEEVTTELKAEIINIINQKENIYNGFKMRRKNLMFNKYRDDKFPGTLRLFRKSFGNFNLAYVHESVILNGKVGQLNGYLLHKPKSFDNYKNHYKVYVLKYGVLGANDYLNRGIRITLINGIWKIALIPILVFLREYFIKRKLLMGTTGLYVSFCSAACYCKSYITLLRLQK